MERTFHIHSAAFYNLNERLEKLNRKALRLGCEPIELHITDEIQKENEDHTVDIWYDILLIGDRPVVKDYTLIASLQHTTEGNIVRTAPGEEIPERYRDSSSYCEHCGTNRRRNDTFIVRNEHTGECKQVGRSCLADYVGSDDINQIVKYFELVSRALEMLEEEDRKEPSERGSYSSSRIVYNLEYFLGIVNSVIRQRGWVSRGRADEIGKAATADIAWNTMVYGHYHHDSFEVTEDDKQYVKEAIEWAKALKEVEHKSEYLHNISVIANERVVDHRGFGIAASLLSTYYREMKNKDEQLVKKSEYFGEVGKRGTFKLKVTNIYHYENMYGEAQVYNMEDENGNIAVWFSNKKGLEKDEEYEMVATVKAHDMRKGQKQTILTRCSVI